MARAHDVVINKGGLTELNPWMDVNNIVVDIVFIHGLGGHPRDTWTYKGRKRDPTVAQSSDEGADGTSQNIDNVTNDVSHTLSTDASHTSSSGTQQDQDKSRLRSIMRQINPFRKSSSRSSTRDKKEDRVRVSGSQKDVMTSDVGEERQTNHKAESSFFWPQNLPESCARARVMTYGYDADVTKFFGGAASKDTFYDHASNLLGALTRKRRGPRLEDRPIVFVAHSLGGLVVKQMLFDADRSEAFPERQKIYQATKALFFLGTPHRGSDYAGWGLIVTGLANVIFDSNTASIKHLKTNSEALMQLEKNFDGLIYRRTFFIFTFSEGQGFKPLPLLKTKIVEYNKVGDPGRERVFTINANHSAMCKYWGTNDPGYETTAGELDGFVQQIVTQVETEAKKSEVSGGMTTNMTEKATHVLELLDYENRTFREDDITNAFVDTFNWMLPIEASNEDIVDYRSTPRQRKAMHDFSRWISCSNESLFWIHGKPGSGKSTLMKRLAKASNLKHLLHNQFAEQRCFVVSFWFSENVRIPLLKSREGMLRSLLYQLLSEHPSSIPNVLPHLWNVDISKSKQEWSFEVLQNALIKFCQLDSSFRILFLVDGLDEFDFYEYADYHESDGYGSKQADIDRANRKSKAHTEIGQFFRSLAKHTNTRVCVASRSKKFDSIFLGQPNICLEDLTFTDIKTYVKGRFELELHQMPWLSEDATALVELQDQIVQRAAGVFLWVRLIIDILVDGSRDFDNLDELREKLNSLPTELGGQTGLYMRMLCDIKKEHLRQAILFLDMVQMAMIPLSLLTLYFADIPGLSEITNAPLHRYSHDKAQQIYSSMIGRLRSRCAGLLECRAIHDQRLLTTVRVLSNGTIEAGRKGIAFARILWKGTAPLVVNVVHKVQFIHFTFLEFLRRPYTQDLLRDMRRSAMPSTSAHLAIAQGTLASLKFLSAPEYSMWNSIHLLLHAIHCAEKERVISVTIALLLDELDRVMKWNYDHDLGGVDVGEALQRVQYWYMNEPQEQGGRDDTGPSDIACIAVMLDVCSYVVTNLRRGSISNVKRGRRSLLEYAVCPPINHTLWEWEKWFPGTGMIQASPQMVKLLLENGAQPNEMRSPLGAGREQSGGSTVWQQLLMTSYMQDKVIQRSQRSGYTVWLTARECKERWYKIASMLLAHGADATCHMPEKCSGNGPLHSALFFAHRHLCPEQDLQEKMYRALEDAGAIWLTGEKDYCCDNCSSTDENVESDSSSDYSAS